MESSLSRIFDSVISWHRNTRRPLPWRVEPSPYHCWIAEIMLQQTRIEAVIPYYNRFLSELPDIPSLAAVPEDRLLKLWEGLGYYSRARNLKKAALLLVEHYHGMLPASVSELKKLPGIGDYTAGAIASIAFGLPEPAVDGNVLRVMTRLLSRSDDISASSVRRTFSELLRSSYPSGENARLLTEGLMELGETICLPNGLPHCDACPVSGFCTSHHTGKELSYPVRTEKKARRIEQRDVFLLRCGSRFAIRKRPDSGLLAGLWEFPDDAGGLSAENSIPVGDAVHIFTHVEWHMRGFLLDCGTELPGYLWKTPEEIVRDYPLPTAFRFYQKKLSEL
ncbi:MAG: A/G-specific adenine glycosylase [Oscillospiraceae bacterium]|nr:A/G-specific adenine glycosylase [Oscillospiraceae bacterium]